MRFRDYKNLAKDCFYHVFNRGNNKQIIFLDDQDFLNFLKRLALALGLLKEHSRLRINPLPIGSFSIISYCLMPNHFHLLIKQNSNIPISKLISKVCTSYSSYFNKKYKRVGHVFQDKFKAKLVDNESYFTYLSAYIHKNPPKPFTYQYSSLSGILDKTSDPLCDQSILLNFFDNSPEKYKKFFLSFKPSDESMIEDSLFDKNS